NIEGLLNNVNTEIYSNCCNCISFVLYYSECKDENKLALFLRSLLASVINIKKYLPSWLVRIYLDETVYSCIQSLLKERKISEKNEQEYEKMENELKEIKMNDVLLKNLKDMGATGFNDDYPPENLFRALYFLPEFELMLKFLLNQSKTGKLI